MIEIIAGDLLEATEKYIAHQTNCVSIGGAAGIARSIFDKYPYADCYSFRVETSKPGTIDILGNGLDQRFVINLHGQIFPGRPNHPLSDVDDLITREKYFHKCLLRIAKIPDLESIAFPYKIGCGLGGGNWEHYLGTLINFAHHVKTQYDTRVVIYRRSGDE